MYTGIAMSRNYEVNLRWSRSQLLVAVNAIGLSFWGTHLDETKFYPVLGIAGVLLAIFWFEINHKTQQWINHWHSCLKEMEPPETELFVFRVFSGKDWAKLNKFPTFHFLLGVMPGAFMAMWICIGLFPVFQWVLTLLKGGAALARITSLPVYECQPCLLVFFWC